VLELCSLQSSLRRKYECKPKDKITIESEKYLEQLKKENELLVEKISNKKKSK
jgi:hypothetical protein